MENVVPENVNKHAIKIPKLLVLLLVIILIVNSMQSESKKSQF